jgi:23S rRNA (adenine2503-C2)-methyltransferase
MRKKDIRDSTRDELRRAFEAWGEPAYRADQAFGWLYKKGGPAFETWSDFPPALRARLDAAYDPPGQEVFARFRSQDGTAKYVLKLRDGRLVETVLIPAAGRATACLSTQVGCKFHCAFCASGLDGFKRNLTAGEIVGQVLLLRAETGRLPTHVVVMGMGEPLDNFENLERALRILNDGRGLGLAARRITVSTAGYVPGIDRFAKLGLQVNLSLSLHAAIETKRSELMPINRTYPLRDVLAACERYLMGGGRKMTFEYILIQDVNDSAADADKLAGLARKLRAKVNLIPYSPVLGLPYKTPAAARIEAFKARLEARGPTATLRRSHGSDILAACGQLAGRYY